VNELVQGNWYKTISFKHDGTFHRSWDKACLIEENDDYIVLANTHAYVHESDGRYWQAKDPAVTIFFKKQWINIICMLRQTGVYYYCNIASPYVIENGLITYIDYDLDVSKSPNGQVKVLDENEFHENKLILNYNEKIQSICFSTMVYAHQKCKNGEFPFDDEKVHEYYNRFCVIQKLSRKNNIFK